MECFSSAMICYRQNTQRILNKAFGIVFETVSSETNLAKGDETQLIFRSNSYCIEPVLLSVAVLSMSG